MRLKYLLSNEPPCTRTAWFIQSVVEGPGGVRGALAELLRQPSTRLGTGIIQLVYYRSQISQLFCYHFYCLVLLVLEQVQGNLN